ncbi:hypothetical protein [Paraburkholderia silvatlantica]|uniref:Uncharacterized protein n=1 Tax=Paraburkholderia silvatlantica TaxID=321895 RepID=A0A2V4T2E5_9BURK|nr:hypothetical protein [Paraburkholderia silvatlantica]PYE17264.1 hypothetical protein C7410_12673 [Paraburkholderia silvatlantica]TDQ81134.1 hypothetical protein C7412_12644 [Paraburkholderia silvatlantica]
MDIGKPTASAQSASAYHAVRALQTLAIVVAAAGGLVLALWLASFFFVASHHVNPLHAGLHAWPDAALAWYDGRLSNEGRRLAAAALFGVVLAFGVPALGVYTLLDRSGRRRLYGSARFANEADIRRAGLL